MGVSAFARALAGDFKKLQDSICGGLEKADGKMFREDLWERPGGGGGRTRVVERGNVIEKGGVNFSAVEGELPEKMQNTLEVSGKEFFATGVSIVMHPHNPWVPIIHMNVRYFEIPGGTSWFGGGIDLTPHYVDKEQAAYFHNQLKTVCDKHDKAYYRKFKEWADDYFFIPHRKEARGVGGIFFDKLTPQTDAERDALKKFVLDVGHCFLPVYLQLIEWNRDKHFGEREKQWQLFRRGRYVEFNLVYDRGTKFGLETHGRIDSILMSLPLNAGWPYTVEIEPGSKEEEALRVLGRE